VTGGSSWGDKGYFVQSTIFYKPKDGADVVQKEIFGPVIVVDTFSTEDEALIKANNSEYGLAAYVYTQNLDRAIRLSKRLEAGLVAVNFANLTHVTIPLAAGKVSSKSDCLILRTIS
jgi:aldehyde dehydrogenase (NAD+)